MPTHATFIEPITAEDVARMRATETREFFELKRELHEAERRGDRYGATLATGDMNCIALHSDSPALREAALRSIAGYERDIEVLSTIAIVLEVCAPGLPTNEAAQRAAFYGVLDATSTLDAD